MKLRSARNRLFSYALACAFCIGSHALRAQNIKAAVSGTVVDAQGAVVPGAEVSILDVGKELTRTARTDFEGRFFQPGLDPGVYKVSVAKPGFAPYRSAQFPLRVGDSVSLTIELHLEEFSTSVDVVAESPSTLQVDDTKQAKNFSRSEMNDLPVQAGGQGRNFYAQALTTPGAALSTLAHRPFAVSGQRPRNNNYLIDSAEMNDANTGFIAGRAETEQLISQEAVESFELITHNFKAEYGRNSGAIVSLVSRSGSNQYHGSAYEYHNNSALSARNPFESRKAQRRSNLAGFTVGGPVRKNRAYFFGNYEFFRPRGEELRTFQTLTFQERARAVPVVRPLADLYPASPDGSRVFTTGQPSRGNQNTYLFRGDVLLTGRQTLMVRNNYTDMVRDTRGIGDTVSSRVNIHNQTFSWAAPITPTPRRRTY